MKTVSIVASIVSVVIGGFAIWLSVTFYRMSNKISEDTKEASRGISAIVIRLETLFDRLYSDTFSMMKDTVSDMRKHIWPDKVQTTEALVAIEEKIEKKAEKKFEELRSQITSELSTAMSQIDHTDGKITAIEERLTKLIDKAITESRRVESEAQEEMTVTDVATEVILFIHRYGASHVQRLMAHPSISLRFNRESIQRGLSFLLESGIIEASGDIENPETVIRMHKKPKKGGLTIPSRATEVS